MVLLSQTGRRAACLVAALLTLGATAFLPARAAAPQAAAAPTPGGPVSGIALENLDPSVRPQDDFFRYVNGKWLATTVIPEDRSSYGTHDQLYDDVQDRLRAIVEGLQKSADPADPDQRKIADLYGSFLDETTVERLGLAPLADELARIDAIANREQLLVAFARLVQIGSGVPFAGSVHQDAHDPARYIFDIEQAGLGLPDRDYYLDSGARMEQMRSRYLAHVQAMLELAGAAQDAAAEQARAIVALETALARIQWTRVQNRDPVKTYNPYALEALPGLAPLDWTLLVRELGLQGRLSSLVVSQPSYFTALAALLRDTPLATWRAYLRWHLLSDYSPYLPAAYVSEHFSFYGKALRGTSQDRPRWKRGLAVVEAGMGQALGRLYVAGAFGPAARQRMELLVHNLLAAYRADLAQLSWMSPETRQRALQKLAQLTVKIGYPDKWRDYGALQIERNTLVANVMNARRFESSRNRDKLGRPIDRDEWEMSPQTVNAYSASERNEIVFPAAYLQPPFFNAQADDAVNYGGIGTTIGHEISHGFDDQGSQYDASGRVLDPPGWFTQADLDSFHTRTRALVAQYAAFAPVPGYPINGELTLGENIADNSGMAVAYQAYRLSLAGKPSAVIDGFTGEQRFFMGWAQKWRGKQRDSEAILRIKSDPHSPREFRGNLPERNLDAFYEAFGVKEGDRMFLPPEQRVHIW